LDRLVDGGLDRGTSTLFLGPAGSGKSTLAIQFAAASARRGELAAIFAFDENAGTILARANGLGMNIEPLIDQGKLRIQQVDPAELAPGEFAAIVRQLVEVDAAKVIVIDSMNGYLHAMPDERFLVTQLHELLTYLSQRGVSTILVLAQHGLMGPMQSPVDLTYLADTVLLFRFFEFGGAIKKAVSVIKKRSGDHEETIREFDLVKGVGIRVGKPLTQFRGVLTGSPTYTGDGKSILADGDESPVADWS
jgi:circadian clock protein KaiC